VIENKLPMPDQDALAHSQRVRAYLEQQMAACPQLSFGDYMNHVLYAPGLGYYSAGNTKFGRAGDFVTAPESSSLFGWSLATQLVEVFGEIRADVLEIGAGTGQLAVDILQTLHDQNQLPLSYAILEPSADLIHRQKARLEHELPADAFSRVSWLSELPENFHGVILANEVLDAMAVECVRLNQSDGSVSQLFVVNSDDALAQHWAPASERVREAVDHRLGESRHLLPDDYATEINLSISPWFRSVAASMVHGLVLIIDYGYPRSEYYAPDRATGTLRCYYRHRLHEDPLLYPGLQDITADVDFTLVVESATEAGFELHGYTTQAQFLLANGLLERAEALVNRPELKSDQERFLISQQVNTLTMASQMGERFQVMGLSVGLEQPLLGFQKLDLAHRL